MLTERTLPIIKKLLHPRNLLWLAVPPLLGWVLWAIPLAEVFKTLQALSPGAILILIALNALILTLFCSRWWLILRAQGYSPPYFSLLAYRLAAFSVAYFTPGPQFGGEPLQVLLLQRRQGVPASTALASVTLDKALELVANFAFLLVGAAVILFSGLLAGPARFQATWLALGLLALPSSYLGFLGSGRLPFSWFLQRLPGWLSGMPVLRNGRQGLIQAEWQAAQFLRERPGAIFQVLLLSLFIWFALVFEYWLALRFLGLRLDLQQTVILLTAARLAFLLPVPAGLGSLEAAQVIAMGVLGANPLLGISISLLIRARDMTLGLLGLWLGGVLLSKSSRTGPGEGLSEPQFQVNLRFAPLRKFLKSVRYRMLKES